MPLDFWLAEDEAQKARLLIEVLLLEFLLGFQMQTSSAIWLYLLDLETLVQWITSFSTVMYLTGSL